MADEVKSQYDRATYWQILATTALCAYALYTGPVAADMPPDLVDVRPILSLVWNSATWFMYMLGCAYSWSTRHTTPYLTCLHYTSQTMVGGFATYFIYKGYVPINPMVLVPIASFMGTWHMLVLYKRLRKLKKQ